MMDDILLKLIDDYGHAMYNLGEDSGDYEAEQAGITKKKIIVYLEAIEKNGKMKLKDLIQNNQSFQREVVVNVAGFLLPIENVRIRDGKIVIVVSASSLEDRQIEIHLEK